MSAVVEVRDLRKIYPMGDDEVVALGGVDLSIDRGEFIAVMGPSGSGKSTFMQIIGMLDRATAGTYIFEGHDVATLSDDDRQNDHHQRLAVHGYRHDDRTRAERDGARSGRRRADPVLIGDGASDRTDDGESSDDLGDDRCGGQPRTGGGNGPARATSSHRSPHSHTTFRFAICRPSHRRHRRPER